MTQLSLLYETADEFCDRCYNNNTYNFDKMDTHILVFKSKQKKELERVITRSQFKKELGELR